MSSFASILEQAQTLSPQERGRLAERLLDGLPDDTEPGWSQAWDAELERRAAELRHDAVAPVAWVDLHATLSQGLPRK